MKGLDKRIVFLFLLLFVSGSVAAADRAQGWAKIVSFFDTFTGYVFPAQASILWYGVLMAVVFIKDPYLIYIYTTYVWIDIAMARSFSSVYAKASGGTSEYCSDAQSITSFFSTVAMHYVFLNTFPGWFTSACCLFGFVGAMVIIQVTSVISVIIAACVGIALGILRMCIFVDLAGLNRIHRGHYLSDASHNLIAW